MERIRHPRIAQAIADHIEKLILQGVLRPGERLTPERELAEKLDVSRPSLRDAIEMLVERGLLTRARGGTFVAQFLSPLLKPLASLLQDNPEVTGDYFEFREMIEAQAARYAARRASDIDRQAIEDCVARMKAAHELEDPEQEAQADVDLHLLIYEAAHNAVLLHFMRALVELLRSNIFYSRQQLYQRSAVRNKLLVQHLAIAEAVLAGDPEAAERAAAEHVRFTFESVEAIRRDSMRLQASLLRVERSDYLAR
ncbi:FCD domain-containing protein [Methyloligella sp. 2.7D]|uniref:FCD domain-containing protein n=1 Tax=unclassified Methyloligella TaxID=2625955 RepID=UPI00157C7C95|nr:FCD domain-containing protein [Methyloligella sp. GL2]QKP76899.1 FCD domain-containing protein [Methyloligella sp. GL2]